MHLILAIPPGAEIGSQRSFRYMEVKRLLALAECEVPLGLELVQSRLLMALYEINHGATDEAYMSLGTCSRAGIVLGLDQHMQWRQTDSSQQSWSDFEEERRTWWAIIILDRWGFSPPTSPSNFLLMIP
jgi:hypothetical protein